MAYICTLSGIGTKKLPNFHNFLNDKRMKLRTIIGVVAVLLSTLTVQAQNIPFRKAEIKETMKKVADWQIANPNKRAKHGDLS